MSNPLIDRVLHRPDCALIVNLSGGKDSQAMLYFLMSSFRAMSWQCQIYLVHANLGIAEWPGTREFVAAQAADEGLPINIVSRRGGLVRRVWQRWETVTPKESGKKIPWMSPSARYCTSDTKTAVIEKFVRSLPHRLVVNAMGFRAQESTSRQSRPVVSVHQQLSGKAFKELTPEGAIARFETLEKGRLCLNWLPIHEYSLSQVWAALSSSTEDVQRRRKLFLSRCFSEAFNGWLGHYAYIIGNERLSCSLCFFAPTEELLRGATYNPQVWKNYCRLEQLSGSSFKSDLSLSELNPPAPAMPARSLIQLALSRRKSPQQPIQLSLF